MYLLRRFENMQHKSIPKTIRAQNLCSLKDYHHGLSLHSKKHKSMPPLFVIIGVTFCF